MLQVLSRIPLHGPWSLGPLGKVSGFGIGIALVVWLLGGVVWFTLRWRVKRSWGNWAVPGVTWLGIAAVIVMIPEWSLRDVRAEIVRVSAQIHSGHGGPVNQLVLGDLYAEALDFPRALRCYRQAATLAPDQPEPHARLAWLLATCPDEGIRDAEEALREAQQACRLTGYGRPRCLEVLAAAHAEAKQW
ncbi:MAG TPA: hypothetical protein EYP14_02040, partial [Planctomycetaceae bacterium]|nr:hypothetical protein [Planctomycetaceae bacterium]